MMSEMVLKNAFLKTFQYSLYYIGKAILYNKYIILMPITDSFFCSRNDQFRWIFLKKWSCDKDSTRTGENKNSKGIDLYQLLIIFNFIFINQRTRLICGNFRFTSGLRISKNTYFNPHRSWDNFET